ncbi:MAG: hypothetical protein ACLPY1_10230 [Terracidiphilus sp.]
MTRLTPPSVRSFAGISGKSSLTAKASPPELLTAVEISVRIRVAYEGEHGQSSGLQCGEPESA